MPDSPVNRQSYSIDEVAVLTGLSVATIRRRIKDGSLLVWQPGGARTRVMIPVAVLTNLMLTQPASDRQPSSPVAAPKIAKPISGPQPRWQRALPQ